jgi:dolichol-phosphate mannosyltransferase
MYPIDVRGACAATIAVVIPCYRVKRYVLSVIDRIGPEVTRIYVVDDCCPEHTGDVVECECRDTRVQVIRNVRNSGVGAAVMTGYIAAIGDGADIIVKIDGDGQMDPKLLPRFTAPIAEGWADYTKGNRFYNLTLIRRMPAMRLVGNSVLSLFAKLSTGYWNLFDPTNGYTAINARVAALLPLTKISERYFFETDMLFRLNTLRAVVLDVPMDPVYDGSPSTLRISRVIGEFLAKHLRNLCKRIFYSYFLRDMNAATFELVLGLPLLIFGIVFGTIEWMSSVTQNDPKPVGTVMLAALPIILGLQLVLSFLNFDVANVPNQPISRFLPALLQTVSAQPHIESGKHATEAHGRRSG